MKLFKRHGLTIFLVLTIIDLLGILFKLEYVHLIVKPLLMPALLLYLIANTKHSTSRTLIICGLVFSFLGDVFLLFDQQYPLFFIFGLLSFLITHIFYMLYFKSYFSKATIGKKLNAALFIPVFVYIFLLLYILFPNLGDLKIPVLLYAIILGGMLVFSMYAYPKFRIYVAKYFVMGATFFVISDSLLAINKFYEPLAGAGFFVMLTYCLAQLLIVKAVIANTNR